MEIKEFLNEVIEQKNKRMIDDVFLFIQNDRDLLKKYLYLVQDNGLQNVNQQLRYILPQNAFLPVIDITFNSR